jgi:hypothetical protein
VIALASFSLPRAERWDLPTAASFKASRRHWGLLLQGPELKLGLCIRISSPTFFKDVIHSNIKMFSQDIFVFRIDGLSKK